MESEDLSEAWFQDCLSFCSGEARGDDDRGADVREDPGSEHPSGVPHNPGRHEDTRAARVQGKQIQMALIKVKIRTLITWNPFELYDKSKTIKEQS